MIATAIEVPVLREGGKRLASILEEVARATVPGTTTEKLNALAEKLILKGGDVPSLIGYTPHGAARPYPATLCVSINDEVVHGIPNEQPRTIQGGDIVGLDCVLTHKGIFVDSALSVIAGKGEPVWDEAARSLLDATKEALAGGIAVARAGNHVGDISAAIEKIGVERGYGIVYELGGHGVGGAVHEEPYIPNVGDAGTGEELLPGMVLAIEPMFTEGSPKVRLMKDGYTFVTIDGSRAAHFEHTILITSGAAEILTAI
ncbi:MAG: type I methionyl aminopeptidase [Patescibacteria group bacterium]|nr:type I methionyl aminopeptidase [Patescibacteria group bacterium]